MRRDLETLSESNLLQQITKLEEELQSCKKEKGICSREVEIIKTLLYCKTLAKSFFEPGESYESWKKRVFSFI